jgi:hypothetical protein
MKLLTQEILKKLPLIYANEEKDFADVKVITKFFFPAGAATWYVTEYDPIEKLFFGFANLGDDAMAELGYFSLEELEGVRHPKFPDLRVERDKFWNSNTSLADVMEFKIR